MNKQKQWYKLDPKHSYWMEQDGVVWSDGSIYKNNDNVDVEVIGHGIVTQETLDANYWGDKEKALYNSIPLVKDADYSGWYEVGDGTETGKWRPPCK